jgi:hypothetical protein
MECHADKWGVIFAFAYSHLGWGSIAIGVIAWVIYLLKPKSYELSLGVAVGKFVGATAIVPAIAIGISAISPGDFLGCITGLELYIVIGALAVIWVAWTVLFPTRRN